jgi:CubicO group peptidase (beta-lactamase class C family)
MGHVDHAMDDLGIPAVGVGLIDGEKRHTCALGITDLESPQFADAETLFQLGPLTSLMTTSALAALIDTGALSLEDPVGAYMPSLPQAQDVTIADLTTHSTGWPASLTIDHRDDADALDRYIHALSHAPVVAPPGNYLSYGKTNSIAAGRLIENVTGLPFEVAIRELVLSPLSMDNSAFQWRGVPVMPATSGHRRNQGSVELLEVQPDRVDAPHLGMSSNLNEILQFVAFHAFASTPPTFISPYGRETIHHPLGPGGSIGSLRGDAMGMGWMISEFGGTRINLLAGSHGGHSGVMAVVPSSSFGIVVLSNADFALEFAIEVVWLALDLFRTLPHPAEHAMIRPRSELKLLTGTYALPDGPQLRVTSRGTALHMESSLDDVDVSGDLTFVSPLTAFIQLEGTRMLVDFVRDESGSIGWIRYLGQLAARTGA